MKTKKVRIALEIDHQGCWQAQGGDLFSDDWSEAMSALEPISDSHRHWIEAEVPVPEAPAETTVTGKAVEAASEQEQAA
jgi:hypothetical protein